MKETLKRALAEWGAFPLPAAIVRDGAEAPPNRSRIISVIGPRRTGKTWVCFAWMRRLLDAGLPRSNVVYLNFEDERLVPLSGGELTHLPEAQEELFGRSLRHPRWFFLDEIQNVPHWSKWVRRVTDQNADVHVVLTGSSSRLLSAEIATELRGRAATVTVLPYSFREFCRARRQEAKDPDRLLYGPGKAAVVRLFNDYLQRGGFPEVSDLPDYASRLRECYQSMFFHDLIERFSIGNVRLLEEYLKLLMSRFASLASVTNLEKELTLAGHHLSKNTLVAYLGYALDAFLLFTASKHDVKFTKQLRNPRKVYAVDLGLVNAVRFSTSADRGRQLENAVFLDLRRGEGEIFYHAGTGECDFVVQQGRQVIRAVQSAWTLEGGQTSEREINGLVESCKAHKLREGAIATCDETADLKSEGVQIQVRPLWYWALKGW